MRFISLVLFLFWVVGMGRSVEGYSRKFNGPLGERCSNLVAIGDGFTVLGSSSDGVNGGDSILLKFDTNGEIDWINVFGTQFLNEDTAKVIVLKDGSYFMSGCMLDPSKSVPNCVDSNEGFGWIAKANSTHLFWSLIAGGGTTIPIPLFRSVFQDDDENLIILGDIRIDTGGEGRRRIEGTETSGDSFIAKYSPDGEEIVSYYTGDGDNDPDLIQTSVTQTGDSFFVTGKMKWIGTLNIHSYTITKFTKQDLNETFTLFMSRSRISGDLIFQMLVDSVILNDGDTLLFIGNDFEGSDPACSVFGSLSLQSLATMDNESVIIHFMTRVCSHGQDAVWFDTFVVDEQKREVWIVGNVKLLSTKYGYYGIFSATTGAMKESRYLVHTELLYDVILAPNKAEKSRVIMLGKGAKSCILIRPFEDYGYTCDSIQLITGDQAGQLTITEIKNDMHLGFWNQSFGFTRINYGDYSARDLFTSQNSDSYDLKANQSDACVMCYGKEPNTENVCSGFGLCISNNNCSCDEEHHGPKCDLWKCFGFRNTDTTNVCGNNITGSNSGVCVSLDLCTCNAGYEKPENSPLCTYWKCDGKKMDQKDVCNDRGICSSPETCTCKDNYEGVYCETFSCGFDHKKEKETCSGHGKCTKPNVCKCDKGFSGELCENNDQYLTIMTPVLSGVGAGFGGIVVIIVSLVCVCFCTVLCCTCVLFCCCLLCLSALGVKQMAGLQKYGKLRNFDLLLREQVIDDDDTIAHLRINSSLFEIKFEEIKTLKVLGEGGSQSIVYKALWKKTEVAFKCFKTRIIMNNQDSFDEFEREVEVMSSVSHPNVIQFFGCTMNPPRVGIVMEFCANGEILDFFISYREQSNGKKRYPIRQKIRMCREIASSLGYLHGRNVIHRDLKSENVLIDANERCKLMDFGLSRCVESLSQSGKTKRIGTNVYMAPEVLTSESYNEKCDVFSYGILLFVLFTENNHPYSGQGVSDFNIEFKVSSDPSFRPDIKELDAVLKTRQEEDRSYDFNWLKETMQKCWNHESINRYSFTDLVKIFEEHYQNDEFLEEDDDDGLVFGEQSDEDGEVKKRKGEREELLQSLEKGAKEKMEMRKEMEKKIEVCIEEIEELKKEVLKLESL